jgi:hypothetical protein
MGTKGKESVKDVEDFNKVVDATSGFLKAVYPPARSLIKTIKENNKTKGSKKTVKTKSTIKKTRKPSKEKAAPAPTPAS